MDYTSYYYPYPINKSSSSSTPLLISSPSTRPNNATNKNTTNNVTKGKKNTSSKGVKLSTDPQSVAARARRHRISDRFKVLQSLVPGGAKLDTVSMLEQAIQYVKFLKAQLWLHQTIINNNSSSNSNYNYNYDSISSTSSDHQYCDNYSAYENINNDGHYYQRYYSLMCNNISNDFDNNSNISTNNQEGGGCYGGPVACSQAATLGPVVVQDFSGYQGNEGDQIM